MTVRLWRARVRIASALAIGGWIGAAGGWAGAGVTVLIGIAYVLTRGGRS